MALTDNIARRLKSTKYRAQALLADARGFSQPRSLDHLILVGTHHKIGTAWMSSIFWRLSLLYDLQFCRNQRDAIPLDCQILLDTHSAFNFESIGNRTYRGLHLLRDPRDVIVSACFYHQRSQEDWLHVKRDAFDGRTYQEKINSLQSLDEQLLFEMSEDAGSTIDALRDWHRSSPERFLEVRYEDLFLDRDLILFHQIFVHLGLDSDMLPAALRVSYEQSMFSGKLPSSFHRRSGETQQWKRYFTPVLKESFIQRFGEVLLELGYEPDNDW